MYLLPALNPMSYSRAQLYKAPGHPMLVIGESMERVVLQKHGERTRQKHTCESILAIVVKEWYYESIVKEWYIWYVHERMEYLYTYSNLHHLFQV